MKGSETHRNGPRSDGQGATVPEGHRDGYRPNLNVPRKRGDS